MWGVFAYFALVFGFGGALHARRAHRVALAAARAEAALVRAELANISGKLNPHFSSTRSTRCMILTRKDPAAAEQALLSFSRMMRYVLDTNAAPPTGCRSTTSSSSCATTSALESLRLGTRLKVDWQIDPATLGDEIPPLTLQPLVENSIVHGIAPRIAGGTVHDRVAAPCRRPTLLLLRGDGRRRRLQLAARRAGSAGGVGLERAAGAASSSTSTARRASACARRRAPASGSRSSFPHDTTTNDDDDDH